MSIGDQPAFPVVFEHGDCTSETPGMTYRQYLVGKALGGLASRLLTVNGAKMLRIVGEKRGMEANDLIAGMAIEMVDATLRKLEAK